MPIVPSIPTKRISQEDFKPLASELMRHVFDIHNQFGRFFDEQVYKRELAVRVGGTLLEVAIDVVHSTFSKRYFADVILRGCGLCEFKAAEAIHPRHISQCIHYLLLFDLAHGMVINVRPERVQREFVNCHLRLPDLRSPELLDTNYRTEIAGAEQFRDILTELIHDWGTGLELSLYEEALTHFLGGELAVNQLVAVFGSQGHLAYQRMRLAAPRVAFKLTGLSGDTSAIEIHSRRLLDHTDLEFIHWANITNRQVTFRTLRK